ncbi:MAG: radical SAM protein [Pseudomonadota bacterium]
MTKFGFISRVLRECRFLMHIAKGGKVEIPFLVLSTGTKCSLRCRNCGNFIPYLPQTLYPIQTIRRTLGTLAEVSNIHTVQIQGGEALLHPELPSIVELCSGFRIPEIVVVTNGTRTMSASLIKALTKSQARLRISNYLLRDKQLSRLAEQCSKAHILYEIYTFTTRDNCWIHLGGLERDRDESYDEVYQRFQECPFKGCLTLEDGILARCSRAALSPSAQKHPVGESDYMDVRNNTSEKWQLRKRLLRYLGSDSFMEACRYCNGGNGERIPPAVQRENGKIHVDNVDHEHAPSAVR